MQVRGPECSSLKALSAAAARAESARRSSGVGIEGSISKTMAVTSGAGVRAFPG